MLCALRDVNPVFVTAVHDRQLCGRLADRYDVAEDLPDLSGAGYLRGTSHSGPVLLRVDHEAGQQGRRNGLQIGSIRCNALPANVSPPLPHLQGYVTSQ